MLGDAGHVGARNNVFLHRVGSGLFVPRLDGGKLVSRPQVGDFARVIARLVPCLDMGQQPDVVSVEHGLGWKHGPQPWLDAKQLVKVVEAAIPGENLLIQVAQSMARTQEPSALLLPVPPQQVSEQTSGLVEASILRGRRWRDEREQIKLLPCLVELARHLKGDQAAITEAAEQVWSLWLDAAQHLDMRRRHLFQRWGSLPHVELVWLQHVERLIRAERAREWEAVEGSSGPDTA